MLDSQQLALLSQELACAVADGIKGGMPDAAERRKYQIFQAAVVIGNVSQSSSHDDDIDMAETILEIIESRIEAREQVRES